MRSPLDVTYNDMILEQQRSVAFMQKNYPIRVKDGSMHHYTAQHRIAVAQTVLRLLRKGKKNKQLPLEDLFDVMPKIKKVAPMPAAEHTAVADPEFFTEHDPY
jgi:hypothetical protein